ncbi:nuclear transport factor 2 family protein [Dyella terrae]|nr:nuclear transport factor 2 family protein [Dyella terrae]
MRGMFLPGGSWFQGLGETSLAAVRAKKPEAWRFNSGSYEKFAKFVGTSPAAIEETFDNVRIETDGTVGTVCFDYRFIADGKQTNHGMETWQVVRESDGWKISAMLYSVIMDDVR